MKNKIFYPKNIIFLFLIIFKFKKKNKKIAFIILNLSYN